MRRVDRNLVALPNNRVRYTSFGLKQEKDLLISAVTAHSLFKSDLDYVLDVNQIFDNLYAEKSRK